MRILLCNNSLRPYRRGSKALAYQGTALIGYILGLLKEYVASTTPCRLHRDQVLSELLRFLIGKVLSQPQRIPVSGYNKLSESRNQDLGKGGGVTSL